MESDILHSDMCTHHRNPRILLSILHPDAVNQIVAVEYHGKSHVIISLLQDYRHGSSTANSLLVSIGFSLYKVCTRVKSGKFGQQVNSDTHLQTV